MQSKGSFRQHIITKHSGFHSHFINDAKQPCEVSGPSFLGSHALALLAISEQALTVGVGWEWEEGNEEDTEEDTVSPQNGQETEGLHQMLQVPNEIWIWEARERNIRRVPEKEEKRKAWLSSDRSGHGRAQRNSGVILKGKILFLGCSVCAGNSLCVRNMLLAARTQLVRSRARNWTQVF